MALELPDWLTDAFNLIGLPWPGIDEDQLRAWAAGVRRFHGSLADTSSRINRGMQDLADSSQSSVITGAARQYERHHQLIVELSGPIDAFAQALDYAADAVVAQKGIVIAAAAALATEFAATQIGALFTLGADEAALPAELISTQQIVKFALKDLEAVVIGRLINYGATELSGHLNRTIVSLANDAWGVHMETQGVRIAYDKVHSASRSLEQGADEAEAAGRGAGAENTSRDLTDSSGGGGWGEVINALRQGLLDIAADLFKTLPAAFSRIVRDISGVLDRFAAQFRAADEESAPAPASSTARPAPVASGAGAGAYIFREPGPSGEAAGPVVHTAGTYGFGNVLTAGDKAAIKDYTSNDGYTTMNPFLRNPEGYSNADAAAIQARADRVSAGLSKLEPRPGTTYRGVTYSPEILAHYKEGSVITEHAFTSTSTDAKVATGAFDGNTLITVTGHSGRDIAPISHYSGESEILYDKGTRFRVLSHEYQPSIGKTVIKMQEVG